MCDIPTGTCSESAAEPGKSNNAVSNFVTIETYTSPWEAHIARGLFENEGIYCFLFNECQIWVDWQMSQALGGVRVQVEAADVPRALAVIKARQDGEYERALETEWNLTSVNCPNCVSHNLGTTHSISTALVVFGLGILFGLFFPIAPEGRRCKSCGARFPYVV